MNYRLEIDDSQPLVRQETLNEIRLACQAAMATRFYDITMNNFGSGDGEDRPEPWVDLSDNYARRVKRTYPTLELHGDLITSVTPVTDVLEYASVETNNPYALSHQEGVYENNLPARPFFPIDQSGELTPYTESECLNAAESALSEVLR